LGLKDLKNKSPIYNWDDIQPMNMTDLTVFGEAPILDAMTMTSAEDFISELGDFRTAAVEIYNPESTSGLEYSSDIKYGSNTYKGSRFDDDTFNSSLVSEQFNFSLSQQFNNKINSLKKFGDIYNDDQTVKDTKVTSNFGGTDSFDLRTAAYNSGYRVGRVKGGNNDFGTEPYIITKVRKTNSGGIFDPLVGQVEQAGRDVIRITKFLTSNAGLAHIAKQNLLSFNARNNRLAEKGVTLTKPKGEKKGLIERAITEGGKLASAAAKFLPLTQKYKPLYTFGLSNIANAAAGLIGVQGSRLVRFRRDFPLGLSNPAGDGLFLNIGGTGKSYTEYLNSGRGSLVYDDKLFYNGQPSHALQNFDDGNLSAVSNVNESINANIDRAGDGTGYGDFMTLLDFNPTAGKDTPEDINLKTAYPNDEGNIESEKHGMPFYFLDLRTKQYVIFRAYIEGLTENIAPEWSGEKYVGRSEPVYTYTGAERDLSFSLKLFAHSKKELKMIYKKMNRLTSLCYPRYVEDKVLAGAAVSTSLQQGFTRMQPPLTKLRMGELYGKPGTYKASDPDPNGNVTISDVTNNDLTGFIKSLSYSVPDESPWEIKKGMRVPKYVTVAIGYQIIHSEVPNVNTNFYGYVGD